MMSSGDDTIRSKLTLSAVKNYVMLCKRKIARSEISSDTELEPSQKRAKKAAQPRTAAEIDMLIESINPKDINLEDLFEESDSE